MKHNIFQKFVQVRGALLNSSCKFEDGYLVTVGIMFFMHLKQFKVAGKSAKMANYFASKTFQYMEITAGHSLKV